MFKKIINKIVNIKTYPIIFFIGIIGIVFTVIGFYGQNGFNLKWFLCLHLPLYLFCGWALYKAFEMFNNIKK